MWDCAMGRIRNAWLLLIVGAAAAHGIAASAPNDPGRPPQAELLKVHALAEEAYRAGDFENAARGLHAEVATAEKANQRPAEDSLKLLEACYSRLNDITAQVWALEKLVTYYPRKEHWAQLIARTEKRAGFSSDLALDVWRLKLATGT